MADVPQPSLGVYGENRVDRPPLTPPSPRVTELTLVGGGFPPGSAVSLQLKTPSLEHAVTANAEGDVSWDETIHHQLGEGATLTIVATYADPTDPDAPPLTVQGDGTVEVIVFEHGVAT